MILQGLALFLIIAIAWLVRKQGLFSATIMAVLTILAAVAALGSYEYVATSTGLAEATPSYAKGISLSLTFALALFAMRAVADRLISRDVLFPLWIEKILGYVAGLVTGVVATGVFLIVVQMAPFGPAVLGYRPYDDTLRRSDHILALRPDEVVLGLTESLSVGSMTNDTPLTQAHPDLLQELYCFRNNAGTAAIAIAAPGTMEILGVYDLSGTAFVSKVPESPQNRDALKTRPILIRVAINGQAANMFYGLDGRKKGRETLQGWWMLPGTQFRLHGLVGKGDDLTGLDAYPVGYLYRDKTRGTWNIETAASETGLPKPGQLIVQRDFKQAEYGTQGGNSNDRNLVVDWIYRLPLDARPQTLTFRGSEQADLTVPTWFDSLGVPKKTLDMSEIRAKVLQSKGGQ